MPFSEIRFFLSLTILITFLAQPVLSAQAPDQISVPRLMENLQSDNVGIAASAARSLGVIFAPGGKQGAEKETVTKLLIDRLPSPGGADLRRESAIALGKMKAESAVEPLKTAMRDKDVHVAMAAGEAISQILPVDDARKYLLTVTADESEQAQVAAYHGLATICKPEDVPILLQGVQKQNWRIQQDAVKGLERTIDAGAKLKAEEYDLVALVLGSEITNASNQAVHFFTHVRNEDSFAAVLKAAELYGDGTKDDETWRNRTYALRTIYHLGWPQTRDALPVVIRQLGDRTANVTNEARRILYAMLNDKQISRDELFPLLLQELEQAEGLRLRAGIMAEMGNSIDREYASRVAKVAAETLEEAAGDPDHWPARAYSLTLLGASGYTATIDEVAKNVGDNVSNVRQAAGVALKQLAPLCTAEQRAKVAPLLQPFLVQPVDWRKTAIAADAVGGYANKETIEPLVKLLGHTVLNVREAARNSLLQIIQHEETDLENLIDTAAHAELESTQQAWEYGASVLGALRLSKSVPLLTRILSEGDWRSQASAALAVAEIATANSINDETLSKALIKASQSRIVQVQDAANTALRALTKTTTTEPAIPPEN